MPKHPLTDDIIDKCYATGAMIRLCLAALEDWPMDGNTCPMAGDIRMVLEVAEKFQGDIHKAVELAGQAEARDA